MRRTFIPPPHFFSLTPPSSPHFFGAWLKKNSIFVYFVFLPVYFLFFPFQFFHFVFPFHFFSSFFRFKLKHFSLPLPPPPWISLESHPGKRNPRPSPLQRFYENKWNISRVPCLSSARYILELFVFFSALYNLQYFIFSSAPFILLRCFLFGRCASSTSTTNRIDRRNQLLRNNYWPEVTVVPCYW